VLFLYHASRSKYYEKTYNHAASSASRNILVLASTGGQRRTHGHGRPITLHQRNGSCIGAVPWTAVVLVRPRDSPPFIGEIKWCSSNDPGASAGGLVKWAAGGMRQLVSGNEAGMEDVVCDEEVVA
jgi:hypothetical protein